ncbi:UDP-3-O-acyl-N-acetylglucosamine deacetylase [Camelimonas fluminis]|uniref:UDP-3-O-acyl-N-acetylglucosamine deacetylase n=1 Tax=Camelimonas fluminis TaxID=1576911 RepID=A0ABV7UD18_9HYPH|nr:UDP-3-O-acyl-N-acetylglucosamine deacetylase [Camelimonas fluminis]GHE46963.1 UDP-3-O-acyl-N-acetylglucosamine deacetylase [Camelimonas fluminis]
MKASRQTTLRSPIVITGNGVHGGQPVRMTLHPAPASNGVTFLRTNLANGHERLLEARHLAVSATALCTVIGDDESGSVATIEHVMSALAGLGVDNVCIEIDGPEVPILDGSAAEYVDAIAQVGVVEQAAFRRVIRVLRPVRVEMGRAFAEMRPYERGFRLDVEIDFDTAVIGRQRMVFDMSPAAYRREISRARTFGFMRDVEALWKAGFARGASLDNTVALGDDGVLNPEGTRWPDEFVRHKILDAIGDLSLAGGQILGSYHSFCGGHRLNFMMLEALFADRANYAIVDAAPRREVGHAEAAVAAVAFAPTVS